MIRTTPTRDMLADGTRLTDLEKQVIRAFMHNDYVSDRGWDDPESTAWLDGFAKYDAKMNPASFSGVVSSLVKKEVIWTNGECFGLTNRGRYFARWEVTLSWLRMPRRLNITTSRVWSICNAQSFAAIRRNG